MSNDVTEEFSNLRAMLWPIHRRELRKFLPLLLLIFFIAFNYNTLRTMKDTLVVATGKSSGAEVIPFIKVWVMFPGSILMTWVFARLCNRLSRENVFYVMLGVFITYFATFVLVLYPNSETIHPHAFADSLQSVLPLGLKGFVAMIRNWSFTIFYAVAELWGNIVLFLLFWGFANQVTHLSEAKRFYSILGIGANIAGIIAAQISQTISGVGYLPWIPYGTRAWDQQMMFLVGLVILTGFAAMAVFRWMHTHALDAESGETVAAVKGEVKGKMSMWKSFKELFTSPYLLSLAIIAIGYNIVINLVEVPWKHQMHEMLPNPSDYNRYMNQVLMMIGFIATFAAFFVTNNVIRLFGWTFTAMMTPVLLLLTSALFFTSFFFKENLHGLAATLLGSTPLALVVFFGTVQNCIARGAKYTVYDTTKEIAFVPLPQDTKIRGKAVIDGVCTRLGKSGGSIIHQILLISFSSVAGSLPYIAICIVATLAVWMVALIYMGRQFNALAAQEGSAEPVPAPTASKQEPVLQA